MKTTLVFDIETIPDIEGLRLLNDLPPDISASAIAEMAFYERHQKTGHNFLPLYQQKIIAISCALRSEDTFRVWSLGSTIDSEKALIQRFYDGIDKYTPQLVSWNGNGFDLPVLHYRSLFYGIQAHRYWEMGEGKAIDSRDFRYNNYINRYHFRHLDLMDIFSLYQSKAHAPLSAIAQLCGFPGKMEMKGGNVWEAYYEDRLEDIRHYCETDVLNTYLIFLRFQKVRGCLNSEAYEQEINLVRNVLKHLEKWDNFLKVWQNF